MQSRFTTYIYNGDPLALGDNFTFIGVLHINDFYIVVDHIDWKDGELLIHKLKVVSKLGTHFMSW